MATRRIKGLGVIVLAAGEKRGVPAIDRADKRSGFSVSNLAASGSNLPVYVRSSNGDAALAVFPQIAQGFETDDAFEVHNPNGVAVSVIIGEIYLAGLSSQAVGTGGGGGGGGGGAGHPTTPGGGGFGGNYYQP